LYVFYRLTQSSTYRAELLKNASNSNKRQGLADRLWNVPSTDQPRENSTSGLNELELVALSASPSGTRKQRTFDRNSSADGAGVVVTSADPQRTVLQRKLLSQTSNGDVMVNSDRKSLTPESVSGVLTGTMTTDCQQQSLTTINGMRTNNKPNEQSNLVTSLVYVNGGQKEQWRMSGLTPQPQQLTTICVTSVKLESAVLVCEVPEGLMEVERRKSDATSTQLIANRITECTSGETSDDRPTSEVATDTTNDDVSTVWSRANFRSEISIPSKRNSALSSQSGQSVSTRLTELTSDDVPTEPIDRSTTITSIISDIELVSKNVVYSGNQRDAEHMSTSEIDDVMAANDVTASSDLSVIDRSSTVHNSVSVDVKNELEHDDMSADLAACGNSVIESSDALDIDEDLNDPDFEDDVKSDLRAANSVDNTPPFIEDLLPENVHILRGVTFQLVAQFIGNPLPVVTWFHDNDPLVEGTVEATRTHISMQPKRTAGVVSLG